MCQWSGTAIKVGITTTTTFGPVPSCSGMTYNYGMARQPHGWMGMVISGDTAAG